MARVLIVDDNPGTRETFASLLRLDGFDTRTAEDGMSGLAVATQYAFDVGLIDLRLPDITGVELIKRLRDAGTACPLVVMTAFPTWDSCFDAASVGATGYVDGPLLGDEVGAVVREALAGVNPVRHPGRQNSKGAVQSTDSAGGRSDAGATLRVRQVVRIVEAELPDVGALDRLAARVGVSSSRLRHQFKALMGVSLGRFILIRRLQVAARLLRATDERIAHVATKVGLHRDLPRFRRAFRRHFNLSPSAYRAAGRLGGDTGSR